MNPQTAARRTAPAANRRALVTGSSSGIGAAIAQQLLIDGWQVLGLDLAPATLGHPCFSSLQIDLLDTDALQRCLASVGAVGALVHAAGFMRTAPLGQLDAAHGEAMWRVHVQAADMLANALAPRMPDGARMVLIGSRVAQGAPGRSQYAACKAALVGMARSWAAELAPRAITVNVVAPAATATAMLQDPARAGTPPKLPPIGRYIEPAEVASLVAFLLSPAGAAITGQQIAICGGASL